MAHCTGPSTERSLEAGWKSLPGVLTCQEVHEVFRGPGLTSKQSIGGSATAASSSRTVDLPLW